MKIIRDNLQVYLGDCLEVLQSLPSESVDLILTDPPYGNMKGSGNLQNSRKKNNKSY